jgi:hypothetical protein
MKKTLDDASPDDWTRAYKKVCAGEEYNTSEVKHYVKAIEERVAEITDKVNNPSHYNQGGIEAIAYIKQQLDDGFISYCEGNVHKYIHRYRYKNGVEDLKKARWYLDRMIEEML